MTYLSMDQGNDRELTITASEDLTGVEVYFTARLRPWLDPIIEKDTEGTGGITVAGAVATVQIDRVDTVDLGQCVPYWDVEVVDGVTDTHTVARGRLAIRSTITQRAP